MRIYLEPGIILWWLYVAFPSKGILIFFEDNPFSSHQLYSSHNIRFGAAVYWWSPDQWPAGFDHIEDEVNCRLHWMVTIAHDDMDSQGFLSAFVRLASDFLIPFLRGRKCVSGTEPVSFLKSQIFLAFSEDDSMPCLLWSRVFFSCLLLGACRLTYGEQGGTGTAGWLYLITIIGFFFIKCSLQQQYQRLVFHQRSIYRSNCGGYWSVSPPPPGGWGS